MRALNITICEVSEDASDCAHITQSARQNVVHNRHSVDEIEFLEDHSDMAAHQPQFFGVETQHVGTV